MARKNGQSNMKTCWVHIGMHKTGSTSIQASLARAKRGDGWTYVKLDDRQNLNQALFAMFDSNPARHPLFAFRGLTDEQLKVRQEWMLGKLAGLLEKAGDGRFILSAEMASVMDEAGVIAMRDFLAARCDEVKVIGYVRAPFGFKNSIFQEQVKHGKGSLRLVGPGYRSRFEKYDRAFGQENVNLRVFDPAAFPSCCVVTDFCEWVGISDIESSKVQRVNESLCREACGMLYAYRKYGPGYGTGADVVRENMRLVTPLLAMDGGKFNLSHDLLKLSEAELEDLAWMENRLGRTLTEKAPDVDNAVASEAELLTVTRETCMDFARNFQSSHGIAAPVGMLPDERLIDPKTVANFMEACREAMRDREGMEMMIQRKRAARKANSTTMKFCWIHIGMHKTGSTSIQESLAKAGQGEGWSYVKLDSLPNLNRALFAMFDSNPNRHPVFVKQGLPPEVIAERRERLRGKLRRVVQRFKGGNLILSTEMASLIDLAGVQEMRDFLAPWFDEIRIVGYVRPPQAFKNSLFQEQVKHGKGTLDNMTLPRYRMRFEKYDKVFGRENVLLREFKPSSFSNKCIVSDFCGVVGIAPPAEIIRVNESLSREACGLLYAYRKLGPGYGTGEEVVRENNQLIAPLLRMEGTKFRFSSRVIAKSPAELEDQAWIEERLGVNLDEREDEDGTEVNSEDDLLRIRRESCLEYVEKFQQIYGLKVPAPLIPSGAVVDPQKAAELLEYCRGLIRGMNRERRKGTAGKTKSILRPFKSAIRFIKRRFSA